MKYRTCGIKIGLALMTFFSVGLFGQANMDLLFGKSQFSYEIEQKNNASISDESNPTKNLDSVRIKCNFYLVDTTVVHYQLTKGVNTTTKISCDFILSDNASTNAIINKKVINFAEIISVPIVYDADKFTGYFILVLPVNHILRKSLIQGKIMKYIGINLKYNKTSHYCMFKVPYDSSW